MADGGFYGGWGFLQGLSSGLTRALDIQIAYKTQELFQRQQFERQKELMLFERSLEPEAQDPVAQRYRMETMLGGTPGTENYQRLHPAPPEPKASPWADVAPSIAKALGIKAGEQMLEGQGISPEEDAYQKEAGKLRAQSEFGVLDKGAAAEGGTLAIRDILPEWEKYGDPEDHLFEIAAGYRPGDMLAERLDGPDRARLANAKTLTDAYKALRQNRATRLGGSAVALRKDETPRAALFRAMAEAEGIQAQGDAEIFGEIYQQQHPDDMEFSRNVLGALGNIDRSEMDFVLGRADEFYALRGGGSKALALPAIPEAATVNDPSLLAPAAPRGQSQVVEKMPRPTAGRLDFSAPGQRTPGRDPGLTSGVLEGNPMAYFDPSHSQPGANGLVSNIGIPESSDPGENMEYRLDIVQWILAHMDERPQVITDRELSFLDLHANLWPDLILPAKAQWQRRIQEIRGSLMDSQTLGSLDTMLNGLPTVPGSR